MTAVERATKPFFPLRNRYAHSQKKPRSTPLPRPSRQNPAPNRINHGEHKPRFYYLSRHSFVQIKLSRYDRPHVASSLSVALPPPGSDVPTSDEARNQIVQVSVFGRSGPFFVFVDSRLNGAAVWERGQGRFAYPGEKPSRGAKGHVGSNGTVHGWIRRGSNGNFANNCDVLQVVVLLAESLWGMMERWVRQHPNSPKAGENWSTWQRCAYATIANVNLLGPTVL